MVRKRAWVVVAALLASMVGGPWPVGPAEAAVSSAPFPSLDAMVDAIHLDMVGTYPTAQTRSSAVTGLSNGSQTPGGFVASLRTSTDNRLTVDPVTRLYRAFFLRVPDAGGLQHWVSVRRRLVSTWTLVKVADEFAKSSEFKNRYGTLSNRDFVRLIYDNVLDRTPDQGGLDYWTRQLDQRRMTRGAVMANFSESDEYEGKQTSEVHVSVLYVFLLRRTATTSQFNAGVQALDGGKTVAQYAKELMATTMYTDRYTKGLAGISQIAAGDRHTCALVAGGAARCWGDNLQGQLGEGTDGNFNRRPSPVAVSGLTGATQLATGGGHTCALMPSATVKCWGREDEGQTATTTDTAVPTTVVGLTAVKQVTAGSSHTCALRTDGTVRCWGKGTFGQLGNGTTTSRQLAPVPVSGLGSVKQVAAGGSHTCALLTNGTVRCWGLNGSGELGDGTTTRRLTPVTVSGLSGASAIATGGNHTCALLSSGAVRCWGSNRNGTLGDGTTTTRPTPVAVSGISTATQLTAGPSHSCVRLANGTVRCWGDNSYRVLGDGTTTNRYTPVAVTGLSGANQVMTGTNHSCAVVSGGTAKCWGGNYSGQLGDTTVVTSSPGPVVVVRG